MRSAFIVFPCSPVPSQVVNWGYFHHVGNVFDAPPRDRSLGVVWLVCTLPNLSPAAVKVQRLQMPLYDAGGCAMKYCCGIDYFSLLDLSYGHRMNIVSRRIAICNHLHALTLMILNSSHEGSTGSSS